MKKTLLLTIAFLTLNAMSAFAYFEVDGFYYNILDATAKTVEITNNGSFDCYAGNVVIPETIVFNNKIYSVTSIGENAFRECRNLTAIIIHNNIVTIGPAAFMRTGLSSIILPNSLTQIKNDTFNGCSYLTEITIPQSVTQILRAAFISCGIKTIKYTGTLESWCAISFDWYAHPLQQGADLYINDQKITEIIFDFNPNNAFSGCTSLKAINFTESVSSIGDEAFSGCINLQSINLPNSISSIGSSAFQGCTSLQSISLPNSISSIGSSAFQGCTSLQSIILKGVTLPSITSSSFPTTTTIIIPCGSLEAYMATDGWRDFNFSQFIEQFVAEWSAVSADEAQGTVNITKSPSTCDDITATFTAVPAKDYRLKEWGDGSKETTRTVEITQDIIYTAYFELDQFTITASANNAAWGNVTGSGEYMNGTTATLTATPTEHYEFVKWNDENIANPRTVKVTEDTTYTAIFKPVDYALTVNSASEADWGTVTGTGIYAYGSEQTIKAIPAEHYVFVAWSDGNTNAERTITISGEETYTATFKPVDYTLTVMANETTWGTVIGTGVYAYGSEQTIKAIPAEHYRFVAWNDGYTNAERTITVSENATYTATFEPIMFTISAFANNSAWGTIEGTGEYQEGQIATVTAKPAVGYKLDFWNDGSKENPRQIEVTQDVTLIATFAEDNSVREVALSESSLHLYAGETHQLTATITPETAVNKNVTWSSYYPEVASVDANGLVTAHSSGTTYIIVTTEDGGFTAYCEVNVTTPMTGLAFKQSHITLEVGDLDYLNTIVTPANADRGTWTWYSSNESVVSVADGLVTAHQVGTATITLNAVDYMLSATCEIAVVDEIVNAEDSIVVDPADNSVTITWSAVEGAAYYILVIYADEAQTEKICTLTFDAHGRLINLNFQRNKPAATHEDNLLNFTVRGLEPNTTYGYSMSSYNEEETIITSKAGQFTTTDNQTTRLDTPLASPDKVNKVLENGTIYILRNGEKYTVDGRKVK